MNSMSTRKPTGNAMPDNHPPFGEVRRRRGQEKL